MSKQYYRLDNILSTGCDYNIILGQRSNGKSYAVTEHILKDYFTAGNQFAYIRRNESAIKTAEIESYFADFFGKKLEKMSGGKGCRVKAFRGQLWLVDNEDAKIEIIGYYFALVQARYKKSAKYPGVYNIVFEELIDSKGYLYNEPDEFQQLVSTILRDRPGKIFLVGNTLTRDCPYFSVWGLYNIFHQKSGTIETYQAEDTKIAVEYCSETESKSGMFFGNIKKNIVSGQWDARSYALIKDIESYQQILRIFVVTDLLKYCLELCVASDTKETFVYFRQHQSEKEIDYDSEIVIQNCFSLNHKTFRKLDDFLNHYKGKEGSYGRLFLQCIEMCLKEDRVVFSDNLTGEEFYRMKGELL